jgi:hypothetical protein
MNDVQEIIDELKDLRRRIDEQKITSGVCSYEIKQIEQALSNNKGTNTQKIKDIILGQCRCHEVYRKIPRTDPDCQVHEIWEDVKEELSNNKDGGCKECERLKKQISDYQEQDGSFHI